MEKAEPAGSKLIMGARIARICVLLLVAVAIGLALQRRLGGDDAGWLHHSLFGALALVALFVEILLQLLAAATGAAAPFGPVTARIAYVLLCLFTLLTAGAGYVTLAASGPAPDFLGLALPPVEPDMSIAEALSRYAGLSPALGDFGATELGAFAATAHLVLALGAAASLVFYLASLTLYALRPAPGAVMLTVTGEPSPEALAFGGRLRFGGWLIVWTQLFIIVASGLMFQLAQPGRSMANREAWYSEPIGWGLVGLTIMGVSLALALLYTRLSKRIIANPERHLDPRRFLALWFLSLGILVGVVGVVSSFIAVTMSVWTLIGKIVSQPPGIAITDPTNFIRMLDMLILIANIGLLMGHGLGVGVTQWLRIHASKARLDMLHALVAARRTEAAQEAAAQNAAAQIAAEKTAEAKPDAPEQG